MDEKKLRALQRHDLVVISQEGKERIKSEVKTKYFGEELRIVEQVFDQTYYGCNIPAIVRRDDNQNEKCVPVGFVPPELCKERRLRIAAFTSFDEIEDINTPYDLLQMEFSTRNQCLKALAAVVAVVKSHKIQVGVLGSAGLEIYTQCQYTNKNSDLDLVVKNAEYQEIWNLYQDLQRISNEYHVLLDAEVSLTNGYGIKAVELFMKTTTLLGKSLTDVTLLSRQDVLRNLK